MGLCPLDPSIFTDHQKEVHRHVNVLGNNIDHLLNRQKQLIEQKIPEQQYNEMVGRRSQLEEHEKTLLVLATQIDSELANLQLIKTDWDMNSLTEKWRSVIKELRLYQSVDRKTYEQRYYEIPAQRAMIIAELSKLEDQTKATIEIIDKYHSQKAQLNEQGVDLHKELQTVRALQITRSLKNS